ncbi:MAG: carbamoyltransferase [Chitinophagales bacterium]|nr:carbamoyltransferase [Chitinophagales bacterium]
MANSNYILGINGGVRPGYQDVSAVLMLNGKVVGAIEEERLNRVKHSAGQLPILSVKEVLRIAGISIQDVSVVAFHGSTWQVSIENVLKNHFENYFGFCPPVKRYHHHDCHAASAFYPSGFDEALVITVDGSGDGISTQIAIGRNGKMELLHRYERPQSLGMFYSMFTQLCGFTRDADEYKLMGLAAYGDAAKCNLNDILSIDDNGYRFNENYMVQVLPGQPSPSRHEMLFNDKLTAALNVSRRTEKNITEPYKNLAAAAQLQLEVALTTLVKKYVRETGIRKICMAGGVALNCLANQKIEILDEVDALFVQPASSDAGISLGAAYLAAIEQGEKHFETQTHTFFGNEFHSEEIEETLQRCGLTFSTTENVVVEASAQLATNKVIGWFQGRMEFGPRALGSRSILANPSAKDVQQIMNHKIKFREGFRPFGASVLEEDFREFFDAKCYNAPYMTKVFFVKEKYRELLKGVTHVDGTCRVQTVNKSQNPLYYELLSLFKSKTGFGVLLNTSFNLNHEPIVNTPREAVASFYASGLDELFIGNFRLKK